MTTFVINKNLIIQKLDKKTVIFDGEKSLLYTLNETATLMLNYLKKGWNVEKITEKIVHSYAVNKEQAKKDIDTILRDFTNKKIILKKQVKHEE